MNVKILLVDDHVMLRTGLRMLMEQQENLVLVGEASTGEKALEQARATRPDVILMDIHLPDINGIEVSRRILSEQGHIRIIIFSSDVNRALVEEALQAGVGGYISKASTAEEIVQAITVVAAGRLYISADVSAEILKDYGAVRVGGGEKSGSSLNDRDTQMLRLISGGRRNKEIASELEVSVKAVEASRSRLMKKLECSSAAELVRYAVREGISQL